MTGFVATDLDGTLMRSDRTVGGTDLETLHALGALGITRVVATGRSLYSARMALAPDFPIDYLVFSTGAGVLAWQSQALLRHATFEPSQLRDALAAVMDLKLSFMVHRAVPDNHHFLFHRDPSTRAGDFELRLARYETFAEPLAVRLLPGQGAITNHEVEALGSVSQLVAIVDSDRGELYDVLRRRLQHLGVVRATSPLDGESWWLEIFPPDVSKAKACQWLLTSSAYGCDPPTLAVGNDYNDEDLLAWGDNAYVVANAPASLRARHANVPSNDESGFSVAVARWRTAIA